MPHKIFGNDQRDREAVEGELPRVMDQEGSRNRFAGSCQRGGSRVPLGATPLGSDTGNLHALGSLNFGWRRDTILDQEHLERSDHRFQVSDLEPEGAKLGISIQRGSSIGTFGAIIRHYYISTRIG